LRERLQSIDRRLITILLIVFVQMLGAAMILPILPLYAKRAFAMSPETITLLVSVFFAAQFLAGPYLGRLSDRHGRVPILILSQIGTTVSFLMLGLAQATWVLFAARVLDGITGGNIIVAQAYITDITPKERRTEALGYIFAVFGIGFVIGPALGSLLSAAFGPRLPYFVAAAAAALTTFLTWRTLQETVTGDEAAGEVEAAGRTRGINPRAIAGNTSLVLVLVIAFVGQFALGMLQSTFALFGEEVLFAAYRDEIVNLGVGLLLSAVGIGQFVTQAFLLRRALARWGDAKLVIIGDIVRSAGLLFFAALPVIPSAVAASIFFAVGMGLMMPPLQSLATYTVGDKERGGVLGVYQSSVSLATILSTAVAGIIFAISPTLPYWIGLILSAIVLVPAGYLLRRSRRRGWEEIEKEAQPHNAPADQSG
jgi:DHA1 family tetracycline resistance protein-like MFS transporter